MATSINLVELTRAIEAAAESFAQEGARASDQERKNLVAACAKLRTVADAPANAVRRAMYAASSLAGAIYIPYPNGLRQNR